MPAPPRVKAALGAVKNIGFSSRDAAPVLKKLLEVYDNNWEYIEENNYQVLIDSILEEQEAKAAGGKGQDSVAGDDPEQCRKRLRKQSENPSSSMLGSDGPSETPLKKPKVEADASPEAHLRERREEAVSPHIDNRGRADPVSQLLDNREKAEPVTPQCDNSGEMTESTLPQLPSRSERDEHELSLVNRRETRASARARKISAGQENAEQASTLTYSRDKRPAGEKSRNLICFKEPKIEPGIEVQQNIEAISSARPKDKEADEDLQEFEVPIAVIPPDHPIPAGKEGVVHQYPQSPGDSSVRGNSSLQANGAESLAAQNSAHNDGKGKGKGTITLKNRKASELVTSQETSSSTIDIASSDRGEVKLLFSFNSDNHPDLCMPSLDAFFKMFEESCLKSYKILQPDFSLQKVMKEMCQFASKLTTEPNDDRKENIVKLTPALDCMKKSDVRNMLDRMPGCSVNGSLNDHCVTEKFHKQENDRSEKIQEVRAPEESGTSHSLVLVQQPQIALGDLRPLHDPCDITRGEERVRISLVNEVSNEKFPSAFHYIPRNLVYQNAYVNFSLARIGDEDCCSDCFGDCLAATIPCACARETGGEFAYTSDGLVKEAFLEQCISMYQEPQKHHHVYCQDCPLERSKNGAVRKCKGHLVRKFIKECWSKCGCSMHCKNRIVQRGITCNLQVFFTPEGKGWGLRTLDELPRGTFVCEYVGEVLTNMELYNRTIQSTGNAKHTYPVLLDADWGSEGVLKDEEALCLDATFYGNVARFVNHRCVDANLVEIPIEVETPDHHYYHLAFFTTRRIERYEELTWDYGIDFDDVGHPVKAFKCRCGSKYCRDVKRSKSRSKALVLK